MNDYDKAIEEDAKKILNDLDAIKRLLKNYDETAKKLFPEDTVKDIKDLPYWRYGFVIKK